METCTIKEVAARVGLSYNGASSLLRRMRLKGFAREVGSIKDKSIITKIYGVTISPENYLARERQQRVIKPLPIGFFNNPFNLKEAVDERYNT